MDKRKVLFICVHNTGRSQIAEAYLREMAGDRFAVESAGFEPGELNPVVVELMKEEGIDIGQKKAKSAFDFWKQGKIYDYVITVCDDFREKDCPVFPGITKRLHWPFPDPAAVKGSDEEKLAKTREIRDSIKKKLEEWIEETKSSGYSRTQL